MLENLVNENDNKLVETQTDVLLVKMSNSSLLMLN